MTIYNRCGAPIEILECYRGHDRGGGFFLVKAKRVGPYPDGSGQDGIGEIEHADDRTAKGWSCSADLRADDGLREINDACRAAPEGKPENAGAIMHYYWPGCFDKRGNRKEKAFA